MLNTEYGHEKRKYDCFANRPHFSSSASVQNILAISDHQAELAEFTIEVLSLVESVTEDVHPLLFPDRLTVSNATALDM